ncbi:hypothetical protein L6R53_00180 [Myxococcota bacterium]|nr:hypothetical protein [Myxococcota bacterium]
MRLPLLPLPFLLLACQGAPAGSWSGALACGDEDSDGVIAASFDLRRQDERTFQGPGEVSFTGTFEIQGAWRDYVEAQTFDAITLSLTDPAGPQDVALTGSPVTCVTSVDGEQTSDQCSEGEELDWTMSWDGGDSLSVDQGDCTGELLRD